MAPILFNPHSCQRCQSLVIDDESRPPREDEGEGHNYIHFNFATSDIITAEADGCSFCKWLLDTEWVHRSSLVNEVFSNSNVPEGDSGYRVIAAVAEASIRHDQWLPPSNPANTLRKYLLDDHEASNDLKLICFYHETEVKFFALWNGEKKHIVYRTRHGFSVFTPPGI